MRNHLLLVQVLFRRAHAHSVLAVIRIHQVLANIFVVNKLLFRRLATLLTYILRIERKPNTCINLPQHLLAGHCVSFTANFASQLTNRKIPYPLAIPGGYPGYNLSMPCPASRLGRGEGDR